MTRIDLVLTAFDLAAAGVFAASGALAASRKQFDIVGFVWLALATGVGGGTARDLLLGAPVFWIVDPTPATVCVAVGVVMHFFASSVESRYRLLLQLDALGMALVTVVGVAKGVAFGAGVLVAAAMGVCTAVVGGVLRDLLAREPSALARREIYVTASLAGALAYIAVARWTDERVLASFVGFGVAAGARLSALAFGWSMPVWRPRPGRKPSGDDD